MQQPKPPEKGLPASSGKGSQFGKLGCCHQNEATNGGSNGNSLPTLTINYAGNPNSAIMRINNHTFRALIDSGSDTCLMQSKVHNSLKGVPKLSKKKACLQTVNGDPVKVHGSVSIKFQIGNEKLEHCFMYCMR